MKESLISGGREKKRESHSVMAVFCVSVLLFGKAAMAAMLCLLSGLALASGPECSCPRRRAREMVCGARVNLDLPARRQRTE